MKKFLSLLLTTAMLLAVLTGCGSSNSAGGSETGGGTAATPDTSSMQTGTDAQAETVAMEKAADSVTVAVDDDSFTIGPWGGDSSVRDWTEDTLWAHLAYRPFIGAMLDKGELQMFAAKSITKVDGTTYNIELFDNITDTQGNNIKASDVVYSYDTLAKLGYASEIGTNYAGSEATGDYTLTLKLKAEVDGAIEQVLTGCSIASQKWYESASENEINSNPATTGAYYVSDMQVGSSVTMTARDNYWKTSDLSYAELQNVNKIVIRCITEASSRSIALENKEVDMAEITPTELKRFDNNSAYNVTRYQNAMSQYLIFNTSENSVCADENVRKAIAYSFDSMMMMMGSGSNECIVSYDVAPNLGPDYVQAWDTVDYYGRNIEKAQEYLAAAGYKPGQLEVHLMVTSQAPQGPYQALQAMMEEAGIKMVIDGYDRAVRQTYQSDPTMWDISEYSDWMVDFTTTFWNDLFNEENYPDTGTQGFTRDDQLQSLLKAASADRSEANMNAFHDYYTDHCYMVGLYTEIKSIVTTSGITNIALHKLNPVLNAMTFTDDYQTVAK